ncbi:coadhesin-like, partial [Stylophora pistillata]|uniref:coadhesin-like n=1 Tax=Stylophora pistillata TaxID=50429 RepID=UPI000C0445F2
MPVCHSLRRGQVIARYVRIIPRTWHGYIACRAGFYGCKSGFEPPKLECQAELGMSSGKIPNSAITATTSYNQYYGPERARLNTVKSGSFAGAWLPNSQDLGQWIQVDLGSFSIPSIPPCQIQLGMQNGKIPNSALTASSKWNANYGPENARLHFHPVSGRQGAWVARVQNVNQWLQVDFGVETQVTRIATQGRQNKNQYVTKYTLRYSLDKSQWNMYQPNGFTMTFPGNNDRYTVVSHNLPKPIRTRYLRIVPEEWYRYIALRAEFYGCKTINGGYSAWGSYSDCSEPCGGGKQTRRRTCTNPSPANGGKDCDRLGSDVSTRKCNTRNCPIDGGYSNWLEWSDCSATCGGGRRARSRKCDNPIPQYDGKNCVGPSLQTEDCNMKDCP